jgi:hypothetical protein
MKREAGEAAPETPGECCIATRASAPHKSQKVEIGEKRRPPCRHGGLESREETPKEGICGRSCRTATISVLIAALASVFLTSGALAHRIRGTVAIQSGRDPSGMKANQSFLSVT